MFFVCLRFLFSSDTRPSRGLIALNGISVLGKHRTTSTVPLIGSEETDVDFAVYKSVSGLARVCNTVGQPGGNVEFPYATNDEEREIQFSSALDKAFLNFVPTWLLSLWAVSNLPGRTQEQCIPPRRHTPSDGLTTFGQSKPRTLCRLACASHGGWQQVRQVLNAT